MSELVLQGTPELRVQLRRSDRARRMTLRVSRLDGRVLLTLPRHVPEREARAFAEERAGWLRKHLADSVSAEQVGIGSLVPLLGTPRRVLQGEGRRVAVQEEAIEVPGPPAQAGRRLGAWLKETARSELAFASDEYARMLGRSYSKLTLRDTRSRWGSCTEDGRLMYSWRLILAPAEVLSYVAAHEVAHLAEMNHSRAFWSVVDQLYGDWREPRTWLREHGHALHRYRF